MQTTNRIKHFWDEPNPHLMTVADAYMLGTMDAKANYRWNPFAVETPHWRAYELAWNRERHRRAIAERTSQLEQESVRVRIAGGEPIHVIEADLDQRDPQPSLWQRVRAWAWKKCLWFLGIKEQPYWPVSNETKPNTMEK